MNLQILSFFLLFKTIVSLITIKLDLETSNTYNPKIFVHNEQKRNLNNPFEFEVDYGEKVKIQFKKVDKWSWKVTFKGTAVIDGFSFEIDNFKTNTWEITNECSEYRMDSDTFVFDENEPVYVFCITNEEHLLQNIVGTPSPEIQFLCNSETIQLVYQQSYKIEMNSLIDNLTSSVFSDERTVIFETLPQRGSLFLGNALVTNSNLTNLKTNSLDYIPDTYGGESYMESITYYVFRNTEYQQNCVSGMLTFKVCGQNCKKCVINSNGNDYVCNECEPNHGFWDYDHYHCEHKDAHPHHYIDDLTYEFQLCHSSCDSCYKGEINDDQYCIKCKGDNYYYYEAAFDNGTKWYNCFYSHDKNSYYLIENTNQLVTTCNSTLYIYKPSKLCKHTCRLQYSHLYSIRNEDGDLECIDTCKEKNLSISGDTLSCVEKCNETEYKYTYKRTDGEKQCYYECPPNTKIDDDDCVSSCDRQNIFYFNETRECLKECVEPLKYLGTQLNCTLHCNEDYSYYDEATNTCLEQCPGYIIPDNKTCVANCNGYYAHTQDKLCVNACPFDEQFRDPSQNNKCVDNCTYHYLYISGDGKECVENCSNSPSYPYISSSINKCVHSCQPEEKIIDNQCVVGDCSDSNLFYYIDNNECVISCESIEKYQLEDKAICVSKCDPYHYKYEIVDSNGKKIKKCLTECIDEKEYMNPTNMECVSVCTNAFIYPQPKMCVKECYGDYYINNEGKCTDVCPEDKKNILYEGNIYNCVNGCPTNYYIDVDGITCVDKCTGNNNYVINKKCTDGCDYDNEYMYIHNGMNFCYAVCEDGKYTIDEDSKLCVDNCFYPYEYEAEHLSRKYCVKDCISFAQNYLNSDYLYMSKEGKKCVTTCNIGEYFFPNYQCTDRCYGQFPYANQLTNQCIDLCPDDLFVDYSEKKCYRSCPSGKLHLNRDNQLECVNQCPESHPYKKSDECVEDCLIHNMKINGNECVNECLKYIIPSENRCVNECSGRFYYLIEEKNECSEICPTDYFIASGNKCVQKCPPQELYHILDSQVCVSDCKDTSFHFLSIDKETCIHQCDISEKYYTSSTGTKICIASCSGQYGFIYGPTQECVEECGNSYPYNNGGTCVNECPIYVKENQCVSNCDTFYIIGDTKKCETSCTQEYPFYNEKSNTCLKHCPDDNKKYYIDTDNNNEKKCVSDCPPNYNYTLITTKQCVTSCPESYPLIDTSSNECISYCYGNVPYEDEHNKKCVSQCESGTYELQDEMKCVQQCDKDKGYYTVDGTHQCVKNCENVSGHNLIDNQHMECLDDCIHAKNNYSLRYNNLCVNKCPEFTKTIGNICEFDLDFTSRTDDFIITSKGKEAIMEDIQNVIYDLSRVGETIKGNDFILQAYPTSSPIKSNNYTSSLDFSECENKLRESDRVDKNEELIVVKFDNINNSSLVNDVEYTIYTAKGKPVDISICNDLTVNFSHPIHNEIEMKYGIAQEMKEKYDIDIYDEDSPFYNDLCYPFQVNDTDILLTERRKEYYLNVSLCQEGCVSLGINYTDKTVNCNCKLAMNNNKQHEMNTGLLEIDEKFLKEETPTNLNVVKCFNVLLQPENLVNNVSFWTCSSTLAITVVSELCIFFIEKLSQFKNILSIIHGNPPKRNNNVNNKENKKHEKDYLEHENKTTEDINNSDNYPYEPNNNNINSFDISHSKDTSRKSLASSSNDDFIIHALRDNDDTSISNNNNQQYINGINTFSNVSTSSNNNETALYYIFFKQNHIDNYPFITACEYDDRSFGKIYCKYIKEQMLLLRICFKSTPFDMTSIQILNLILYFNLSSIFNGIFYFNKYIQFRYDNSGKFHFSKTFINAFYSFILSIIIVHILNKFISHRKIMETLIIEIEKKEDREKMSHKAIKAFMRKMILMNIIAFLIGVFSWYYLTLFNGIYHGTQIEWFIGCVVSLGYEIVGTLIYVGVITGLRVMALKKGNKAMFNVALYIRKVLSYN